MTRRWRLFGLLALIYILAYFYRISLAVSAKDVAADLRLSAAQLGTLSGVFFYVYALAQIPLGPLIDCFGGRLVLSCFGVITACGGILFPLSQSYGAALAGRVLIGVGTSCVLMASLKIFTRWFSRGEFARVSGMMVAMGNLGNMGATLPLAAAIAAWGWRRSLLAVGLLQGAVTLLVFLRVRDLPPGEEYAGAGEGEGPGLLAAWGTIFRDRSFLLLALLSFFWYGNYMVLQGLWGGPYLM
ncbi:MAG TPA: MFS transporter, partial [Verrucomicrobiae bacterium]|nr:MFS transporter [Verrucomicrobiae bacterium]